MILTCKGCQIMLLDNISPTFGLANGSLGKIIDYVKDENGHIKYLMIKFLDN